MKVVKKDSVKTKENTIETNDPIKLDRSVIRVKEKSESDNNFYLEGTVEQRLSRLDEMNKEAIALSGKYDVEQRLQRNIIRVIKRKG